ncbi:PREDICTED: Co2+/Mg2+ efflux ApaG [Prunus dulcis]|uniref:PREDICTED: Co2+/Mg2+ efflux ApaG n=1 Tax=Prunus dulcis TaxID=3755 RepID=A0A5E4FST7_PRUDU|nr:uncharacterized protein LOC117626920 [Prunus dulcis]VVA30492.1 PREDICTED: Co2+/Mg2+ efflux ApaG [Prunus dulcis]
MHSMSLKVCTDYCSGTRTCLPGRGSFGSANSELRNLRVGPGFRDFGKSGRVVACVPERNGNSRSGSPSSSSSPSSGAGQKSSSFLSRSQSWALMKQQMEVAANTEDYEEAARIRDSLKLLEEEEPILWLRRKIKEAIAEERFEDAAKYRDELKEIAPYSFLKCSSDATTLGIRVQVRSVYIEGRSQPSKGQHFFAYRIRISNNSDRPVQLLRRHWIITDANGKSENVWGIGVIGEQPVILPQASFEYSSACPLSTPTGRMEGDFEMKHINSRVSSQSFNVAIAPFSLSVLGDDIDTF